MMRRNRKSVKSAQARAAPENGEHPRATRDPSFPQFVIRYYLLRTQKPLSEITGDDIPLGFGTVDAVVGR